MQITLDITGMYYRNTVTVDEGATVFQVMQAAAGVPAPNGGIMQFKTEDKDGMQRDFVNSITVEYGEGSTPESRQINAPASKDPTRPKGIYTFDDNAAVSASQIKGGVTYQLAWQYYITNGKTIKNLGDNGKRGIVPVKRSDDPEIGIKLVDGDTITWRLVAIYGLYEMSHTENSVRGMKMALPPAPAA